MVVTLTHFVWDFKGLSFFNPPNWANKMRLILLGVSECGFMENKSNGQL